MGDSVMPWRSFPESLFNQIDFSRCSRVLAKRLFEQVRTRNHGDQCVRATLLPRAQVGEGRDARRRVLRHPHVEDGLAGYEASGNVAAMEDARGVVTRAAYNTLGQRTRCGRARHFQPVCTRIRLAVRTRPAVSVRFAERRSTAADLNQPQV